MTGSSDMEISVRFGRLVSATLPLFVGGLWQFSLYGALMTRLCRIAVKSG